MRLVLLILLTWACQAQVHVNACTPGDAGFTGGTCYTSPIPLPAGAPAYLQQERYGNFSYHFPMADGTYTVVLHFVENSTAITTIGQRLFSVSINGATVLTNFDLAGNANLNTPIDRSFPVAAAGGTGITIVFTTVVRNAVVSAIDITAPPPNPFPGCSSDGAGGIACTGGITDGVGQMVSGAMVMSGSSSGAFGFSVPDAASTVILLLMPADDGTGKLLKDSGAVPCPKLSPQILALHPVCHQAAWQ